MATFNVYNHQHEKVSTIDLSDEVFAAEPKEHLLWEVVKWQLASRRRGCASTKTRGDINASGKKIYRQKGTGRARHGDVTSPTMVGGASAFGPKPKDWSYALPKKVRRSAMKQALSLRTSQNRLIVVKDFQLSEIKTKTLRKMLESFDASSSLLIDKKNENLLLSARNLEEVKVLYPEGLNVYDLLKYPTIIVTEESAKIIEKRLAR